MSTVIGLVQDGKVYMGADSFATTESGERRNMIVKKIFTNGLIMFGFVGSVRSGQVLKPEYFKVPKNIYELPDKIRLQFEEKGCLATNSETQTSLMEGNFLIATAGGKLYEMLSDFQFNEISDFTAIGSGSTFALGSLFTSKGIINDPKARVLKALEASAFFDSATGPPFVTEIFLEDV